jgi:tripartite-type tricarboxylate transporter receptor subunit TctC
VDTQAVASAVPDGYVLCVCSVGAISIAPFAQKVGIVSSIPQTVIVRKDLPVKSMADLISYAKANPGKLNYGSSGVGGLTHYSVELFLVRTGTSAVHIPFRGESTAAVLSGEVDFAFCQPD